MTDGPPKALWAELRRGSTFVLVPELAWLSLMGLSRSDAGDEPIWDEHAGAWLVSAPTAEALSAAAQARPIHDFMSTLATYEGPLVSGTTSASALTYDGAAQLREDLVAFLRLGSFSWSMIYA
jgi:hypothetical protein